MTLQLYASARAEIHLLFFQENNLSKPFKKLRLFHLYCQLILESIENVHLEFLRIIARGTSLINFREGFVVRRDCAECAGSPEHQFARLWDTHQNVLA